jgi:hypothetical protein
MRSVLTKGKHKGEVTKSSGKGKPWSKIWKKEMARCKGEGSWIVDGMGEWEVEHQDEVDDAQVEENEDDEFDETLEERDAADDEDEGVERDLKCSPVTVIYGHAGEWSCLRPVEARALISAGRGLDIKPYSKGIDTGCVVSCRHAAIVPDFADV